MDSSEVISAVRSAKLTVVDDNPHYRIFDCTVKEYPAWTLLVQTSGKPISLGRPTLRYLNTERLREFVEEQDISHLENSPLEIYTFRWVAEPQGKMIFDVGWAIDPSVAREKASQISSAGFVLREEKPLRVASIAYEGPFPHQPKSGWGEIQWERRAKEKGLVYSGLYRELYHAYDWAENRHVVEIQMQIDG